MKYCIGCVFLRYQEPETGWHSECSSSFGEDAELACQKGHWKHAFSRGTTIDEFEGAMEMAEECLDFKERPQ